MASRLKQLELHGYKTFASRTQFQFPGRITAVVGPNGSGKSNIADSLRWVLGEQSYSLLRGRKTEDMIFAGSEFRPRAGMASAAIVFDNEGGWLPIDFTEVEIPRRAYRDGNNEYLLNGQRVRLKEISELLAQSGLAERTYTIIGQGLVDAALEDTLAQHERQGRSVTLLADGQGVRAGQPGDAQGYVFPPLWGKDTFNNGAGMNRLAMATRFVKHNMPQGASFDAPQLTDDEAYDVSAFMLSKPRPEKANLEADFPARWNKPVDSAFPPYMLGAPADQHRFGPFPPLAEKQRQMAGQIKAQAAAERAKAQGAAR